MNNLIDLHGSSSSRIRLSIPLRVLQVLHLLLGIGGLYGGVLMVIDPTGNLIGFTPDIITRIGLVRNFTLPGIFLLTVMGVLPLILVVALSGRMQNSLMEKINPIKRFHWAWTASLLVGVILIGWIGLQVALIGWQHPVQVMTGGIGVLIVLFSLLPNVRDRYSKTNLD